MPLEVDESAIARVLAGAATLDAADCRRLHGATQRLDLGTYAERLRFAAFHRYQPWVGPFSKARITVESNMPTERQAELRGRIAEALRRAAGGAAEAPGDPGRVRTLLRRWLLIGVWVVTIALFGAVGLLPWTGTSKTAQALGMALLAATIITIWVILVPTRAPILVNAVEGEIFAEALRDQAPTAMLETLGRPWQEAIQRTVQPLPRSLIDRLAGWTTAAALIAIVVGLAIAMLPGERVSSGGPGVVLIFVGIAGCFVALGLVIVGGLTARTSRAASVGPSHRRRNVIVGIGGIVFVAGIVGAAQYRPPVPPWTDALMVIGVGIAVMALGFDVGRPRVYASRQEALASVRPTSPSLLAVGVAGAIGVVEFGVGDATHGLMSTVIFVAVLLTAGIIPWLTGSAAVIAAFLGGGLVGTWLSVMARAGAEPPVALDGELLSSAFVGLIALVPAIVAYRVRRALREP
jgi:hypothetical protein